MNKECRFCKAPFISNDDPHILDSCDGCRKEIMNIIKQNPEFVKELLKSNVDLFQMLMADDEIKFKFLETVLDDDKILMRIAKRIFEVPAKAVGLGGPGSIAQYFPASLSATTE